ncbi:uncharacterized protein BDZ99DRAFT_497429 [Mytilinidion resinicola]|uniref:DUF7730 domain-containing protein n=1 Tax=Mytilinidion resinicola TaxID=574789 RepID=A0A6A6YSM1_9PEZI|nr:uncharacterized protein BDZ99DRAFT_497429 [Mytilinidion resinicola]KAF2811781.1 hypothetical protein BDZ99DRAFT_497429 [Mytilinidion resinicola]
MRASGVLLSIFCGPCVCIYVGFAACFCPGRLRRRSEPEDKRRFERRQRKAPRPLVVRKRALSIPLPEEPETEEPGVPSSPEELKQTTIFQEKSRLMALPLELREMIYKAVLGNDVMHVIHKENKLGHLRCKANSEKACPKRWHGVGPCADSCWGVVDSSNIWMPVEEPQGSDGDVLPLLQTCRQVYSEAFPLLYSTNTFSFIDLDCLRYLSATILPSRFNAIKSLRIEWYLTWPLYDVFAQRMLFNTALYPPHDEATWEDIWRIIAGMTGLQRLRVDLKYFDGFRDNECEQKMLAPLRQVKGLKEFDVYLGWKGKDVTGAPFKLTRPVNTVPDDSSEEEDW